MFQTRFFVKPYKKGTTMVLRLLIILVTLLGANAYAQKMSMAQDAFLNDVNSLAGVAHIGKVLFGTDSQKKEWGAYCTDSGRLAAQGDFRLAIRAAARALYIGESQHKNYGAPIIYASRDIANAYSYAGDHATASLWADRALIAIDKGYESWAQKDVPYIKTAMRRIKALDLSHNGKHAESIAEMQKAIDGLPMFSRGDTKTELLIALSSMYSSAGSLDKASNTIDKVLSSSLPPYLIAPANRAAGDLALLKNDAKTAAARYSVAITAAGEKYSYQLAMAHLGLARAARKAGDMEIASTELAKSLGELEKIRSSFSSFEMRTALYGNLQSVFDEAVDFYDLRGEPEKALAASESGRARAMLDLQRKVMPGGPSDSAVTRPKTLTELQALMAKNQSMVVYHQLPQRVVAWVIKSDSFKSFSLAVPAEKLRKEISILRAAIEQENKSALSVAQSLHQQLFQSLNIAAGDDLIVVPHRNLHLLPFQTLHNGTKWLVEIHSIATAMSASLYETSSKTQASQKLAAVGNPDLGKPEWALPGAEAEVKAIQALYADNSVFVQKDASKANFLQIAPGAEVVHVAAHAVVDEIDPMYSTIKLAVVGLTGSDMEAREFAGMDLRSAGLVTLSACNSGRGKVADGDEFFGFKRALVAAGAKSVLVSLWPVDDESTKILMTEFHQAWKTTSKARAMQMAQIKVLSDPKYSNPFYWAAFTLIGDPG